MPGSLALALLSAKSTDEIMRAICGLYTSLLVDSAYIGGKLDLAKAIAEKNEVALQNPCDLFITSNADSALR